MTFAIDVRNPRAGWVDVELRVGDQSFTFAASHVLNDPLRELADLALFIAHPAYHGTARVRFWLEPAGYELAVTRDATLELVLGYSEDASPAPRRPEVVVRDVLEPSSTATELLRCLRATERLFAGVPEDVWRNGFPTPQLRELETLVR